MLNPIHTFLTDLEGDFDKVMATLKECHEAVHRMGYKRVSTESATEAPLLYC